MNSKPERQTTDRPSPKLTTLDAILLVPLAAPFVALPLGFMASSLYCLVTGYIAAIHAPATQAAWWQWPWDWPGAWVVEAFYLTNGASPASDFSHSDPLHPFAGLELIDRAFMALLVNTVIATIPLWVAGLFLGGALRVRRWTNEGKAT